MHDTFRIEFPNGIANIRGKYWWKGCVPDTRQNRWEIFVDGCWEYLDCRRDPLPGEKVFEVVLSTLSGDYNRYTVAIDENEVRRRFSKIGAILKVVFLKTI